jgi:hypothetical protein
MKAPHLTISGLTYKNPNAASETYKLPTFLPRFSSNSPAFPMPR